MLSNVLETKYKLDICCSMLQVSALILENTFTSILDMAGLMLPFLRWFIGGSSSKGPKLLNCVVRSPWSTLDIVGQVSLDGLSMVFVVLWRPMAAYPLHST
jgi:hypothetical protein